MTNFFNWENYFEIRKYNYNVLKNMNMNLFNLIPIIIFNIFNSKNKF